MNADLSLERLSDIALALPEVSRELVHGHAIFRVRRKVFAYFLLNHHGDGKVGLSCKVLKGDNKRLVDGDPERFYLPAYTAHQGWVALRLDTRKIDWEEVAELVRGSYVLMAPKTLASKVEAAE